MNAGFIIYGLLVNGFAYGLYRKLEHRTGARLVGLLLGIHGAGVVLLGIFQVCPKLPGAEANLASTSIASLACPHSVFSTIQFFALVIGMWMFARTLRRDSAWHGLAQLSVVIAMLDLGLHLMSVMERFDSVEGMLQRALYFISLVWAEAVSLRSLPCLVKQS